MLSHQEQQKIIGALLRRKQNALCADCNSKMPCWASLDFGVFVCMNCSGAHRALGPSVTRVKSTRLDTWNRDWLQNMEVGNSILNLYWQNQLNDNEYSPKKPTTNSSIQAIIKYVQDKYVRKLYVDPKQKMNPLQKYKSGQSLTVQNRSKNIDVSVQKKAERRTLESAKKEVKTQSNKQQSNKVIADFSVFDKVVKVGKTTAQTSSNLINLEQQKVQNSAKNLSFDDFQFGAPADKNKQVKYNKQQFVSMGGVPAPNNKNQVNFESFRKINYNQKQNSKTNDFISFDMLIEKKNERNNTNAYFEHVTYFQQKQPAYGTNNQNNKNIYATMGGFNPSAVRADLQKMSTQKKLNQLHQMTFQAPLSFDRNYGIDKDIFPKQDKKISLESNLNFDTSAVKSNKTEKTSWTDQWK